MPVITTIGDMDDTNSLPNDITECHGLLVAAYKQSVQLEQQAADAERRLAESEQQVAELGRVLDETSSSYQQLQQEHAATLDELAWYKRWAFGRRRERFAENEGQGHLFDLDLGSDLAVTSDPQQPTNSDDDVEVQGHRRRRTKREIDWYKLPHIRHDHALPADEEACSGWGRPMDRPAADVQ